MSIYVLRLFNRFCKEIMKYRNNPLNIRYSRNNPWIGQSGQRKGFCEFRTFGFGLRAAVIVLNRYNALGFKTIGQIISRWAPPSDNNPTSSYILFVCDFMNRHKSLPFGLFSEINDDVLYCHDYEISDPYEVALLLCAMATFEQGQDFNPYIDDFIFAAVTYSCTSQSQEFEVNPVTYMSTDIR